MQYRTLYKIPQAYLFKVMVEISALKVVMGRNSEYLHILFFIDFDSLCKFCSALFKCHLIASNLEK